MKQKTNRRRGCGSEFCLLCPSVFAEMDEQEKAFVIASIKLKIENDKKEKKRVENKSKKKGR